MKRILVTGGAGFIGSHLVDRLLATNVEHVTVVDDFNDFYDPQIKRTNIGTHLEDPRYQLIEVDIPREEAVRLRRVAREQPLEVRGREAPGVGLEKATARRTRQWWDVHGQNRILDGIPAQMIPSSVPTLVKASSAN